MKIFRKLKGVLLKKNWKRIYCLWWLKDMDKNWSFVLDCKLEKCGCNKKREMSKIRYIAVTENAERPHQKWQRNSSLQQGIKLIFIGHILNDWGNCESSQSWKAVSHVFGLAFESLDLTECLSRKPYVRWSGNACRSEPLQQSLWRVAPLVTVFKLAEPFNHLIFSLDPQQAYRCCMTVMNTPWAWLRNWRNTKGTICLLVIRDYWVT